MKLKFSILTNCPVRIWNFFFCSSLFVSFDVFHFISFKSSHKCEHIKLLAVSRHSDGAFEISFITQLILLLFPFAAIATQTITAAAVTATAVATQF